MLLFIAIPAGHQHLSSTPLLPIGEGNEKDLLKFMAANPHAVVMAYDMKAKLPNGQNVQEGERRRLVKEAIRQAENYLYQKGVRARVALINQGQRDYEERVARGDVEEAA